jgi:alcohol dehydrogenase class IV
MLPSIALVDPNLTIGLPPALTATTGMDAFTQVLEPFVSCRANPFTDALCKEGLCRAAMSLRTAFQNGEDTEARTNLSLVSVLGGLALANAGLGAVHGFAGPLGGMFDAPHGALCATLLPYVMEANVTALQHRDPESEFLARYHELARILTGDSHATAIQGVLWVKELVRELKIPSLRAYGIASSDTTVIVEKSRRASSMRGNPIELTDQELAVIVSNAL